MTGHEEKYAERIAKLLAKAESTTPEEAELLVTKAQELMTTYAIDQAMIDAKAGVKKDYVVEERIRFEGVYRLATFQVARAIAVANNCKVLQSTQGNGGRWGGKANKTIYLIGYKSDVDRVHLLNASLQIQCARALGTWWKNEVSDWDKSWWTSNQKNIQRREFIFGFANGIASKLWRANEDAKAADATARAEADETTEDEAAESVALVLRSRKDTVQDWYDEKYGKLKARQGRSYSSGGASAHGAGSAAGRNANTGAGTLRSQGALSR